MKDAVGDLFFEAFICTTRVTHLSLFCLIYRAIPAEPGEGTVFGKECIASARQALEEHEKCMSIIHKLDEDFLETYVNWYGQPSFFAQTNKPQLITPGLSCNHHSSHSQSSSAMSSRHATKQTSIVSVVSSAPYSSC